MDGFDAIGKPIPDYRKENALGFLKEAGFDSLEDRFDIVVRVAGQLQRDKPFEAMKIAQGRLDITGSYRLFAVLLTG